jgi:hypothetical protein
MIVEVSNGVVETDHIVGYKPWRGQLLLTFHYHGGNSGVHMFMSKDHAMYEEIRDKFEPGSVKDSSWEEA